MAQDVTVTLTNQQVSHALESARTVYPDATNAELEAMLVHAATHGPGVYAKIGEWDAAAFREEENDRRKQALADFEQTFPPPEQPGEVETTDDKPKRPRKPRAKKKA